MSEKENNIDLKPGTNQDDLMDFDRDPFSGVDMFADLELMEDEGALNLSELNIDDLREMYVDSGDELKAEISMAIAKKKGLKSTKKKPRKKI